MILRSRPAAAIAGAASWTLVEYGLHRGAMHEMRGRGLPSVEHLGHHADVTYFSPASKSSRRRLSRPRGRTQSRSRWRDAAGPSPTRSG